MLEENYTNFHRVKSSHDVKNEEQCHKNLFELDSQIASLKLENEKINVNKVQKLFNTSSLSSPLYHPFHVTILSKIK